MPRLVALLALLSFALPLAGYLADGIAQNKIPMAFLYIAGFVICAVASALLLSTFGLWFALLAPGAICIGLSIFATKKR